MKNKRKNIRNHPNECPSEWEPPKNIKHRTLAPNGDDLFDVLWYVYMYEHEIALLILCAHFNGIGFNFGKKQMMTKVWNQVDYTVLLRTTNRKNVH